VTRRGNVDDIHIFTTHFYTALEEGVDAVANWTQKKKRPINVFEKKLIFIPSTLQCFLRVDCLWV
jgi:Ulp1 family protease